MTRAIILAAGQGTRLRPLTNDKPKCLVPLKGKPLLSWQKEVLQKVGVNDIHVVGGYLFDKIKEQGYDCTENKAYADMNMVGTLYTAIDFINQPGDLIISYGDIVYQPDNLQCLLQSDAEVSLMVDMSWRKYWELRFEDPLSDAETLLLDDKGYITELGKKPNSYDSIQGQYTGLIKIRADKVSDFVNFYQSLDPRVKYDGQDFSHMYMTSLIQALIDASWQVKAVPVDNGWLEVDSVSDIETYEKLDKSGELSAFCELL